jgi:glycerol kinase
VPFDRKTGKALHNAIVWLDKRTSGVVKTFEEKNGGDLNVYRDICGLPINTYFSAVKMRWLLNHVPEINTAHEEGSLVLGTIDTWLVFKLTGGKKILTDSSNASRTMLMDINTLKWSEKMLTDFGIKIECLPEIKLSSSDNFG